MTQLKLAILIVASGALLTACGSSTYSQPQQVTLAPQNQQQTGFIIQGDEASVKQALAKSSEYRVLSAKHNLYEVKGLDAATLKSQFPSLSVEKNLYFESLIETSSKNPYEGFIANGQLAQSMPPTAVPPALEGCAPGLEVFPEASLEVLSQALSQEGSMELGEELHLSAAKSKANEELEGDLEIRWDMVTPNGSELEKKLRLGEELKLKPDMVGVYRLVMVVKQGDACAGTQVAFAVTHNPDIQFAVENEEKPTIPLENFPHLKRMSYDKAQAMASGKGVVVAVLDTGLNYNHRAIKFNLAFNQNEKNGEASKDDDENSFEDDVLGWDFVNGDNSPFDDEGHGSHVAGLVSSHIHGMAPGSKIMPIKVLNAGGGGDTASVIAGIYYATDNGAQVINASLQRLSNQIPALTKAIEYAHSKNVVFISASGNDGLDLSRPGVDIFPGEIDAPNVVNVAALGATDLLTDYSNYGNDEVDVAAPGGDGIEPIYSLTTLNPQGIPYIGSGGTSMAAPIVAGVAALILEANPSLTTEEVRTILMSSGKQVDAIALKVASGRVLDAAKAVEMAQAMGTPLASAL